MDLSLTASLAQLQHGRIEMSSSSNSTLPIPAPFNNSSRLSLLLALSSQATRQAQRSIENFTSEAMKYANPLRGEARNLEEALMTVPNLETIPYRVLRREKNYEVREVESYVVAETTMPGNKGFDFYASSQGFNTLATYLFGKNLIREEMEMTTPVLVSRTRSEGEKMEMTTPVISQQTDRGQWKMAFVMPSKYGDDLPMPVDKSVAIRRVPSKMVAVTSFSGYVTDDMVKDKEQELRRFLKRDAKLCVKESAQVEVSQFNPPFTPPFMRRNEISVEVEQVEA